MYAKLALRNIKRSAKDYVIYFITIILIVMFMYSFLALGFSSDILSISENMPMLTNIIAALSVVVTLISSFIISYAVRFMLTQRKKEFATYELLGMEINSIQRLFLTENTVIGILAFFIGLTFGTGLVEMLIQFVKNIFDIPHTYQISFSIQALVLSLIFFTLMYGSGIVHAVRIIRRKKIVELLYDSHKNEVISKQKHPFSQLVLVILSVLTMVVGMFLIRQGLSINTNLAWAYFIVAIILLLSGIYVIYQNFPLMLIAYAKQKEELKYSECNLFYLGQIGHRVQSSGRIMAITAILITFSLATMFIGLVMGAGYKANMNTYYPYDAGVAIDAPLTKNSFDDVVSFVDEKCHVQENIVFYLHDLDDYSIQAIALSDYNSLRLMLGLEMVELPDDEYLVHCDTWTYIEKIKKAISEQPNITIQGVILGNPQARIYEEAMEQNQLVGTKGYVIVVPDEITEMLQADKIRLVMKLENEGFPELRSEIRRYLNSGQWEPELQAGKTFTEHITIGVAVKAWGLSNSLTGFTVISFCGLYLSIIFILLSCSILAFEQLSALDNNRRNYQIIDKMGVSRQMQQKLIHRELSTFFFIPIVFPIIVILVLIFGAQSLYSAFIYQKGIILLYGFATIAIFAIIYFAYYIATFYLFKSNIAVSKV